MPCGIAPARNDTVLLNRTLTLAVRLKPVPAFLIVQLTVLMVTPGAICSSMPMLPVPSSVGSPVQLIAVAIAATTAMVTKPDRFCMSMSSLPVGSYAPVSTNGADGSTQRMDAGACVGQHRREFAARPGGADRGEPETRR